MSDINSARSDMLKQNISSLRVVSAMKIFAWNTKKEYKCILLRVNQCQKEINAPNLNIENISYSDEFKCYRVDMISSIPCFSVYSCHKANHVDLTPPAYEYDKYPQNTQQKKSNLLWLHPHRLHTIYPAIFAFHPWSMACNLSNRSGRAHVLCRVVSTKIHHCHIVALHILWMVFKILMVNIFLGGDENNNYEELLRKKWRKELCRCQRAVLYTRDESGS